MNWTGSLGLDFVCRNSVLGVPVYLLEDGDHLVFWEVRKAPELEFGFDIGAINHIKSYNELDHHSALTYPCSDTYYFSPLYSRVPVGAPGLEALLWISYSSSLLSSLCYFYCCSLCFWIIIMFR